MEDEREGGVGIRLEFGPQATRSRNQKVISPAEVGMAEVVERANPCRTH